MSFEERNTYAQLLTGLAVMAYAWVSLRAGLAAGAFAGDGGLQSWARQVLWIIGGGVALGIVLAILTQILYGIVTGERKPDFSSDERDRHIALWGIRVTLALVSAGFIGVVIGLATGWSAVTALTLLLAVFALGSFIGETVKAALYRIGA